MDLINCIVIPQILVDETMESYLATICAMNGLSFGELEKIKSRGSATHQQLPKALQFSRWIAALTGKSSVEVLSHHSFARIRSWLLDSNCTSANTVGETWDSLSDDQYILEAGTPITVAMCKACADEDLAFWGRRYVRRMHQLPGILHCEKHLDPLMRVPRTTAFREPFDRLACVHGNSDEFNSVDFNSPVARGYIALVEWVLHSSPRLDDTHVRRVLSDRAHQVGLGSGRKNLSRSALKSYFFECTADYPSLRPFVMGDHVPSFSRDCLAVQPRHRLVGAACLYEHPEDFQRAILGSNENFPLPKALQTFHKPKRRSSAHSPVLRIRQIQMKRDELISLYERSGGSLEKMERLSGRSPQFLSRHLDILDIPLIAHRLKLAVASVLAVDGKPVTKAAKQCGVLASAVEDFLPRLTMENLPAIRNALELNLFELRRRWLDAYRPGSRTTGDRYLLRKWLTRIDPEWLSRHPAAKIARIDPKKITDKALLGLPYAKERVALAEQT